MKLQSAVSGTSPALFDAGVRQRRPEARLSEVLDLLCALGPVGCIPGTRVWGLFDRGSDVSMDWMSRIAAAETFAHRRLGNGVLERIRLDGPVGALSLVLLPDTDFLAWDQLAELLSISMPRQAGHVRNDRSELRICRFESVSLKETRLVAVQPATLSTCGRCALKLFAEARLTPNH